MSDSAALMLLPRFEEIAVADKGYNELFMTAEKAGA